LYIEHFRNNSVQRTTKFKWSAHREATHERFSA